MRILEHGFGGVQDLPIPLHTAIIGAVAALIVSFIGLALTSREVRTTPPREIPLPHLDRVVSSDAWRLSWQAFGLFAAAYLVVVATAAPDLATNPLFGVFYVWMWVGLVFASLVFGPVWKAISPVRTVAQTIARLRGTEEPLLAYPTWLGMWPAALGLLAFSWLELVYPGNNLQGPVRLWLFAYAALLLLGTALFGEDFCADADPFEVYSSLVAKLSPWGRTKGHLVLRRPLANLDTLLPRPGLVAVVSVLFGTIVYDSFKDSVPWLSFLQDTPAIADHASGPYAVSNIALVVFPLAVAAFYVTGTMLTGVGDVRRRDLPSALAPSLVPIVVGYVVAHYLSFWWASGQATLRAVSDPFLNGGNWFGTAQMPVSYWLSFHPTFLAVTKVVAVVVGHILGVVSAHRRALAVLPRKHVVTGQIPLLVTMIGFTVGGLYLLFSA